MKGSSVRDPSPAFEELVPESVAYRVWVLVPSLKVNVYPEPGRTQQPMLQFTGDADRLARGWGSLAMLVAPDQFKDGETVTFFDDQVLWTDRLRAGDPRTFSLWLRENNRSAPTRFDQKLLQVERVAEIVEDLSGAGGFKIPARRAVNLSVQAFKELQQDWLILKWSCPWRHVLAAAIPRLNAGPRPAVLLRTRVASTEEIGGKPVAEVTVVFVVQKIDSPTPADGTPAR